MATVTVRELRRDPGAVIDAVTSTGRPALISRGGRFVAAVVPLDEDALEDFVLARVPGLLEALASADRDAKDRSTVTLAAIEKELDAVE